MNTDIKKFIRENEVLFWGVKAEEKENISLKFLAVILVKNCFESSFAILMTSITAKKLSVFVKKSMMKQSRYF